MNYSEYKRQQQEGINALPIFYAFSDRQLEEALQARGLTIDDTDKIYRLGDTGGFYLKTDAQIIRDYFTKKDNLPEYMKNSDWAFEAFLYEMNNFEYAINGQGDWDVCNQFSDHELDYDECKTYVDYLREAGMEYTIPAYKRALKAHYKEAENWL